MLRNLLTLSALPILFAACGADVPSGPIALINGFDAATLEAPVVPAVVEPAAWQANAGSALALTASFGWSTTTADEGAWRGTSTADRSIIALVSEEPLGGGDDLYAIEVRLRVSAGRQLLLTTLGSEGPPTAAFSAPDGPPMMILTDLVPGEEMQTYRIEMNRSFPMGPFSGRDIERVVMQLTDEPAADVELESVRLIFRREFLDGLASGIGWHGLNDVFRETLLTRAGETARIAVDVPPDAWLDLAVGTLEEQPVTFEVVAERADGSTVPLVERTITTAERWENEPTDLGALGGERVEFLFRARSPVAGALAFWGHPTVRQRGFGAAAAESVAPQGVILVIADTLRRDHLSAYGYERDTTPELAAMAGEGVLFDNAIAQGTWTKISVPSILTSLHPTSHGILQFTDRLPAGATTMAEVFRQAGYATLQTSSVPFSGQLTNLQQGVEVLHESASLPEDAGSKTGRILTDRVLEWIETHRDVPFFAMIHAFDPHSPYEPAAPYNGWWTEPNATADHKADHEAVKPFIDMPLFKMMTMPTREDLIEAKVDPERYLNREIGWYDGSIRALDAEIGRLKSRLKHLGLTDKVAIVFLADHGEELLDHGQHWHGPTVYAELTEVPLLFWAPGYLPSGVEAPQTVQLLDVMPTVLDLAGLPVPEAAQGQSLLPLIASLDAGEEEASRGWRARPAFSESASGPNFQRVLPGTPEGRDAIVDDRWRLIENVEPPEGWPRYELFDRNADPLDQNNVASEHPEVVADLAAKLEAWRDWAQAQQLEADSIDNMSAEELARLRSLGYI